MPNFLWIFSETIFFYSCEMTITNHRSFPSLWLSWQNFFPHNLGWLQAHWRMPHMTCCQVQVGFVWIDLGSLGSDFTFFGFFFLAFSFFINIFLTSKSIPFSFNMSWYIFYGVTIIANYLLFAVLPIKGMLVKQFC